MAPVLRRAVNITRSSASIPARLPDGSQQPFFFLRRPAPGVLRQGSQAADLFVEGHELGTEILKAMEFGNLPLRFAERSRARKGLRAMHLAQDTNLRCVPRIVGLGTMTVGLTTAMHDGRNGTRAQITQT
jgi:hypothetical protein